MASNVLAVSAAELASIRADLAAAVLDTACTQKRPTKTPDAYGTSSEPSLTTIATFNVGLEKPSGSLLTEHATLIASQATWVVHCPYAQAILQDDEFHIGSNVLIVQKLLGPQSLQGLTDVLAVEIK